MELDRKDHVGSIATEVGQDAAAVESSSEQADRLAESCTGDPAQLAAVLASLSPTLADAVAMAAQRRYGNQFVLGALGGAMVESGPSPDRPGAIQMPKVDIDHTTGGATLGQHGALVDDDGAPADGSRDSLSELGEEQKLLMQEVMHRMSKADRAASNEAKGSSQPGSSIIANWK